MPLMLHFQKKKKRIGLSSKNNFETYSTYHNYNWNQKSNILKLNEFHIFIKITK